MGLKSYHFAATLFIALLGLQVQTLGEGLPKPKIKDAISDRFVPAEYSNADFDGYLAGRMKANLDKRLLTIDLDAILTPYLHRPGVQAWVGEHVGKFLHAAALAYQANPNETLKKRMDYAARTLISTQLPDGYLGTYLEKDRWTSWDVWSHKYNMIGLMAYYRITGYEPALEACKKMGDLLAKTFGTSPGQKDIIASGTHVGMAPTSILEPMVMLYRYTGAPSYLDFCHYLVNAWEQDDGPKLMSSMLEKGDVHGTADSKAYEMMSCLVGLMDLYRVTGEKDYFEVCEHAWRDIAHNKLYIIGTTSYGEHFPESHHLDPVGSYRGSTFIGRGRVASR